MEKIFQDELNIYIFTTKFVIEQKEVITLVSHDIDGDWQFMSESPFNEADARVLSLQEILSHDPSLLELADLPLGYEAHRKDIDAEWEIYKSEID